MAIYRIVADNPNDGDYVFETHRHTPLQVVRWSGKRTFISFTATTQRIILPTGSEIVELTGTEDCYVAFGGATVNAVQAIADDASRLFLAGVQVVPVPIDTVPNPDVPFTYIAVIQKDTAGILQIERVL